MPSPEHRASDTSTLTDKQNNNDQGSRPSKDNERSQSQERSNDDVEKQQPKDDEHDPNLIDWDGPDDKENPMNWPASKKWTVTIALGMMTLCVTFASSVFSLAIMPVSEEFGIGEVTATLGVSLFVLGFAVGPLIFSPLSELFGRKKPLFIPFAIFAIFQIPVAVAQNVETIMLCRFFGGVFASAPLGIVGGTLADYFGPVDRGIAVVVFAGATFVGPTLGPVIGGFITESYLGWRWTAWITLIMAAFFGLIALIIVPETSAPVILQQRAKKIRYQTRNWAIHSKLDEKEVNAKELLHTYLLRPIQMLVLEPILLLITLYMALIYGILYLFFEAFPLTFQEQRGWSPGVGSLPFIGVLIGVVIGGGLIAIITKTRFARKLEENDGKVVPEERLIPMIIGGGLLPAGLFWFAWTSNPAINPAPQIIATIPIGAGVLMIFLQGLNYIIDVYKFNANSAIAANSLFRSTVGAGFPLFATAMFNNLGIPWATSLLAFLCVALFPVPILFFIYGDKIRKLSKFSPDA